MTAAWPVAAVVHLVLWGFVVWLGFRLVRPWLDRRSPSPERLLRERFARGEIDDEELDARLRVLEGTR